MSKNLHIGGYAPIVQDLVPLLTSVFFTVTVPTQRLKVVWVQRDGRVFDVDRVQMYLVMDYLRRDNQTLCLAFLAKTPNLSEVRITAILPRLCLIELCLFSLTPKKRKRTTSLEVVPLLKRV
jgi:hypothetical protein